MCKYTGYSKSRYTIATGYILHISLQLIDSLSQSTSGIVTRQRQISQDLYVCVCVCADCCAGSQITPSLGSTVVPTCAAYSAQIAPSSVGFPGITKRQMRLYIQLLSPARGRGEPLRVIP